MVIAYSEGEADGPKADPWVTAPKVISPRDIALVQHHEKAPFLLSTLEAWEDRPINPYSRVITKVAVGHNWAQFVR